jgi:hypothetical protein
MLEETVNAIVAKLGPDEAPEFATEALREANKRMMLRDLE